MDIRLTDQQKAWIEDAAAVSGKNTTPPTSLTPERWLFRIMRNAASATRGTWLSIEQRGYTEGESNGRKFKIPRTSIPSLEWPVEEKELPKDALRLFVSDSLKDALLHTVAIEMVTRDEIGMKRAWNTFAEWLDEFVADRIIEGKAQADRQEWEEEENSLFSPGKKKD